MFCAFDLLAMGGRSLIGAAVEQRKAMLEALLDPLPPAVQYTGHFDAEHGRELYERAKQLKLEGLVAKRLGSTYEPGVRSPAWQKVKVPGAVPPERFKR